MWFTRRKEKNVPIVIAPPPASRMEIELHKGASEQAAEKAKEVNKHIKDLLVENGFTVKIALSAGAKLSKNRQVESN